MDRPRRAEVASACMGTSLLMPRHEPPRNRGSERWGLGLKASPAPVILILKPGGELFTSRGVGV